MSGLSPSQIKNSWKCLLRKSRSVEWITMPKNVSRFQRRYLPDCPISYREVIILLSQNCFLLKSSHRTFISRIFPGDSFHNSKQFNNKLHHSRCKNCSCIAHFRSFYAFLRTENRKTKGVATYFEWVIGAKAGDRAQWWNSCSAYSMILPVKSEELPHPDFPRAPLPPPQCRRTCWSNTTCNIQT